MYVFLSILPVILLLGVIGSMVAFAISLCVYDNSRAGLIFFIMSLVLVIPMLISVEVSQNITEQDITVWHNKTPVEVYHNVHSISRSDTAITFTDRQGNDYSIIEGNNRRTTFSNPHEYKGKQ